MDNLIIKPTSEFIEENKNADNEEKEISKACKIVCEANEEGTVGTLEIKGNTVTLLSMICTILVNMEKHGMEKHGNNTAKNMAMIILSTLEMEQEKND